MGDLQVYLDCTNWHVFRSTTNSLVEYTETVTYINFCEDSVIPSVTRVSYNKDEPWFTVKLKQLRSEKDAEFSSDDKDKKKTRRDLARR